MGVIVILILFSLIVAIIFLAAFFWAVRSGQFDDTESPAVRILFDEKKPGSVSGQNNVADNPKKKD